MYGIFRLFFYGKCREIYHTYPYVFLDCLGKMFRTRRPEKSDAINLRKNFQRFEGASSRIQELG